MKLFSLTVSGFRGYADEEFFDLDADAVIIVGANGTGKTSFFDAILWAITGSVPRLGAESSLVSRYSPTNEARVELVLSSVDGQVVITRRFAEQSYLSVKAGDQTLHGVSAESLLLDRLWPHATVATEPWSALSRSITRAIYLQQDLVREFVEQDDDAERFQVVSELFGAGFVGELQRQLEGARKRWSTATNRMVADLDPLLQQRNQWAERLGRLTQTAEESTEIVSRQKWLTRALATTGQSVSLDALPTSPTSLQTVLNSLTEREQELATREARLLQLLQHTTHEPAVTADVSELRSRLEDETGSLQEARERLSEREAEVAALRRRQVEVNDENERLKAFARLALQLLSDTCPVCAQEYDRQAASERLSELAGQAASLHVDTTAVRDAARAVEALERSLSSTREQLAELELRQSQREQWQRRLVQLARDAQVGDEVPSLQDVRHQLESVSRMADEVRSLRREGEHLSLMAARAAELEQRSLLRNRLDRLEQEIARNEAEITRRMRTGELASQVIDALREAGQEVVLSELKSIEPLLQRIFSTVDPHPSFRVVRLLAKMARGRGRLATSLSDQVANVPDEVPGTVLSSSQLNVLAVSSFLSLNFSVKDLPVTAVALDDPLQSLDTINLLGLTDLLRRIAPERQVLVSTHDEQMASLLQRKLRPVRPHSRTHVIRLEGWSRTGPRVLQERLETERAGLRLVSA
jgi:DNA repair exonuclease SbcCD ATPase subunit